jgi:hypothetical protein
MGKWNSLDEYNQYVKDNFGKSFLNLIKLRPYEDKKMKISASMSKFSTNLKYCDYSEIFGKDYLRIRPNYSTYKLTSKVTRKPMYLLPCDRDEMSICIFPHKKTIEAFMQDKKSYSQFGQEIFSVSAIVTVSR